MTTGRDAFYVFVLFRQVDVVRQALDIDGRQLGLDQRHRVGDELRQHVGVVGVDPLKRDLLFEVGDLADRVQLGRGSGTARWTRA